MAAGDLTPSAAFLADPSVAALTALQNPAFDPSSPELFYRVFRRWGSHVVTQVAGGASLEYAATVDRSAASDKQSVSAKLDLEYKAVLGDEPASQGGLGVTDEVVVGVEAGRVSRPPGAPPA